MSQNNFVFAHFNKKDSLIIYDNERVVYFFEERDDSFIGEGVLGKNEVLDLQKQSHALIRLDSEGADRSFVRDYFIDLSYVSGTEEPFLRLQPMKMASGSHGAQERVSIPVGEGVNFPIETLPDWFRQKINKRYLTGQPVTKEGREKNK